jgi:hypothetical protein
MMSLEDRAATAFKDGTTTAAAFEALIAEAQEQIGSVSAARKEAQARALDPMATRLEKDEAAGKDHLLELQLRGLQALVSELVLYRDRKRDSEEQEKPLGPWEEERRHREELAAEGPEIAAAYAKIADWLRRVRESNNRGELLPKPRDATPLPVTEALARGIAVHEIGTAYQSVVGATRFPRWNAESTAVWPSAPASGISPAVAAILPGIEATDRAIRERWASLEREAS